MAVEFKGHVARLHREMIALLPKYCLSVKLQKQLRNLSASNGPDGRSVHVCIQLAIEEVTANIVSFCRTVISCKCLEVTANIVSFCRTVISCKCLES